MELLSSQCVNVPNGYHYDLTNGVHCVMEKTFKSRLDKFLEQFSFVQKQNTRLPKNLINDFPFVDFPPFRNDIFSRQEDLARLPSILHPVGKGTKVLEIGTWNGWLSKRLAQQGRDVVAADIFIDDSDGLQSKQHHSYRSW